MSPEAELRFQRGDLMHPEDVAASLGYEPDDYKRPGFMADLLDRVDRGDV